MTFEARYSGPGKSGICKCGCSWQDHHLGMVMRQDYHDATQESYIPDECCRYGCNEVGGMKYNKETKEWEDHCYGYEDKGVINEDQAIIVGISSGSDGEGPGHPPKA